MTRLFDILLMYFPLCWHYRLSSFQRDVRNVRSLNRFSTSVAQGSSITIPRNKNRKEGNKHLRFQEKKHRKEQLIQSPEADCCTLKSELQEAQILLLLILAKQNLFEGHQCSVIKITMTTNSSVFYNHQQKKTLDHYSTCMNMFCKLFWISLFLSRNFPGPNLLSRMN